MDSNPIHHPSPAKKMKCSFLYYIELLMISRAGWWTWTPSATPLQIKKWMLIFGSCYTSYDQPGWSMDLNPICHPSPAKKMKYSFLDYVQLLMISWAGRWTQTPFITSLQPKKWNAHFLIMFNFWWSAGLVNGLKPHLPPLSSQRNEMLIFGLRSTSDDCITLPGWSMDWNHICHLSPAKNIKCYFLDYVQLLMISQAGQWTQTLSSTPLQPKKWNAHFCITFNIWCWPDWSMDLNLIHHSSPAKNMKSSFLGYIQLLMISWAVWWTQTPSTTPLQPIKWNASFWIMFTSDDQPGWLMDSNRICHPSPDNKMKYSFLDYVQLLMISWAGRWTQTPFTTPLQPKKWNAHFLIMFNFWWSAGLVNGLKLHLPPFSSQRIEMLLFGLRSTSDDQLGWSMDSNPILHLSPAKEMKCSFLDYVQLLMIGWAG